MKLSADRLEVELAKFNVNRARAQRVSGDELMQFYNREMAVAQKQGFGVGLIGSGIMLALAVPAGAAAAPVMAVIGIAGAFAFGRHCADKKARTLGEALAKREADRTSETAQARQQITAILEGRDCDGKLLKSLKSGAIEVNGPGMVRALIQIVDERRVAEANQIAAPTPASCGTCDCKKKPPAATPTA